MAVRACIAGHTRHMRVRLAAGMASKAGICAFLIALASCTGNTSSKAPDAGSHPRSPSTTAPPNVFSHVDSQSDVVAISGEQEDFDESRPAPELGQGDIRNMHLTHSTSKIKTRVKFVDLSVPTSGKPSPTYRVEMGVKTDAGVGRGAEVDIGFRGGLRVSMFRLHPYGEGAGPCQLGHSVDRARGVVVIDIPRSCLKDPRWVRVSVSCVAWYPDRAETVGLDDAMTTGYPRHSDWSPRLRAPG